MQLFVLAFSFGRQARIYFGVYRVWLLMNILVVKSYYCSMHEISPPYIVIELALNRKFRAMKIGRNHKNRWLKFMGAENFIIYAPKKYMLSTV